MNKHAQTGPDLVETILLVEDQRELRDAIQNLLSAHNFKVLAASDANEALKLGEKHQGQIHLMITDFNMPGLNGFELINMIFKSQPAIKIILMSGLLGESSFDGMSLPPNVETIEKPFTLKTLLEKIRATMSQKSVASKAS